MTIQPKSEAVFENREQRSNTQKQIKKGTKKNQNVRTPSIDDGVLSCEICEYPFGWSLARCLTKEVIED